LKIGYWLLQEARNVEMKVTAGEEAARGFS
jgi:hypothetical protein